MATDTKLQLVINEMTYAQAVANAASIGTKQLIITTDKVIPVPTTADAGKFLMINSSGEYQLTTSTSSAVWGNITGTLSAQTDLYSELSAKYVKPAGGIPRTDLAEAYYLASNPNNYTSNTGTITGIKMNGSSKGTSGVVDLGTVITAHQDISGKANIDDLENGIITVMNAEYANLATRANQDGNGNTISSTYARNTDIPTVNNGTLTVQLNGKNVQTFTSNQSTNATANIQALPNFSLNISHQSAGNPRPVKFLTVNYNTAATYFKMSATSCHDNGTSYQFLEDIIIGCTTSGSVVCNVYKYCQQEVSYDGATRNYGDVFYVVDTTNKIVDFYILCGQWASSQFTPATKIGNTTIAYITQYTGAAAYYSSGVKVWGNGDSTTYARLTDIPTMLTTAPTANNTGITQMVYLESEPAVYYNGYVYYIKE